MKALMTVESADLRVGQAHIRLVPVEGQTSNSADNRQMFAHAQNNGAQSFTLAITNKESFGAFVPGSLVEVTFNVVEVDTKAQETETSTAPPAPVNNPGASK